MNVRPLNPQRIPNHFRFQTYIEEELANAQALLRTTQWEALTSAELADIGLIYLETGNFAECEKFTSAALALELKIPQESQDKEVIAKAHYMRGTAKRESNDCAGAFAEFAEAAGLTQSDWLKSNILRNAGLTHLKLQEFEKAAAVFKEAFEFTSTYSAAELRGSLPALSNYYALCLSRAALQKKQNPKEGLRAFEETTVLYDRILREKNFSDSDRLKCNDLVSHEVHCGQISCEMAEQQNVEEKVDNEQSLKNGETLLLHALEARKANKADDQRLGDVCKWLGRTYMALNETDKARTYIEAGLWHYKINFANRQRPGDKEPFQITEMKGLLEKLPAAKLSDASNFAGFAAANAALTMEQAPDALSRLGRCVQQNR